MTKTSGTKQWAAVTRNCCKGCTYDCRYCYAKKKATRFKRSTKETWKNMEYRAGCEKEIRKVEGTIMFPTTHDIPYEQRNWWMPFLTGLLQTGNNVLIVSKPNLKSIMLICDTLSRFNYQIEFRFTIGTDVEKTREFWEPNAPSIQERITALKFAKEAGFKTSVSMEPLLTEQPLALINRIRPYVTGTIWIGTMNHINRKDITPETQERYERQRRINSKENMQQVFSQVNGIPGIRWKDTVQELLGITEEGKPQ